MHHITSSEEALKVCEYNFFHWKVVLLVIYLFNHNLSKSTLFMLNIAFDVQFLSNKLEFLVSCNIKITGTSFFLPCFYRYFFNKKLIVLHRG